MVNFDLNLLRNLAMLLHTRSVTAAARRLNMSQPAMSRSLAELRQLLHDPLLVRTRGGMLLTRRAEELIEPVHRWLHEAARLAGPPVIDVTTLERRFRIAAADYGLVSILRPVMQQIMAAAPGVSLDIVAPSRDSVLQLAAGDADLVLSSVEPDKALVHERHLICEPFVCVVRPGHPIVARANGEPLALDEILAWPHVGTSMEGEAADPITQALSRLGRERRVVTTTPYIASAQSLLHGTDMILTLPASVAQDGAANNGFPLIPAPVEFGQFNYWLTWHTRSQGDPAIQWLIKLISDRAHRLSRTWGESLAPVEYDEAWLIAAE